MTTPILEGRGLVKDFVVRRSFFGRPTATLRAVDDVSLSVAPGETLGLVGESGCGKSTLGRVLLRLEEPTRGSIHVHGSDVTHAEGERLRALRRKLQIVFQDPVASLDPRMTVRAIVAEGIRLHGLAKDHAAEEARVAELLTRVGLRPELMHRYPHEFSGGQRQRIGIARALAVEPELIVADEPVSALDVSIQAQILNLLRDLQDELGIAFVFVAHDLSVVEFMSHRIAVMYLGRIVELLPRGGISSGALHPYTQALRHAAPVPDPSRSRKRIVLPGEPPSPLAPPAGCPFHPRCPLAKPGLCDVERPALRVLGPGHSVACHRAEEAASAVFTVDPPAEP